MWSRDLGTDAVYGTEEFLSGLKVFCTVCVWLNMILVRCVVLALWSFACAACTDLHEGQTASDPRRLRADFGGDEERRSLGESGLSKRSAAVNEQTCPALPEVDATLQEDTHSVSERFGALSLFVSIQNQRAVNSNARRRERASVFFPAAVPSQCVSTWNCLQCAHCKHRPKHAHKPTSRTLLRH